VLIERVAAREPGSDAVHLTAHEVASFVAEFEWLGPDEPHELRWTLPG